jgi:adenylate cyclase
MGIGINTGEVVVGNIGSERRVSYGAVGTPINAAYRIESFTVGGQILISPTTHVRVKADLRILGNKEVKFKGLYQPVVLYDIGGIGEPYNAYLTEKKEIPLTRLELPLEIECFPLEGKTVSDRAIAGRITHLGGNAAEASLDEKLAAYMNLRILLKDEENRGLSEIYAKVLPKENPDTAVMDKGVRLQFTSMSQETRDYLAKKQTEQVLKKNLSNQ